MIFKIMLMTRMLALMKVYFSLLYAEWHKWTPRNVSESDLCANVRFSELMNVSSRCWSPFHAHECVFSRNEQLKGVMKASHLICKMIKMRHKMTSFTISTHFNSWTVGHKTNHVMLVSFLFEFSFVGFSTFLGLCLLPKSKYCLSFQRCPNPSKCVNTLGSYYCVCNPGWEKVSEFQCSEINECSRGIHGCDRNSYCVNTAGSWKCICNSGWYPDPSNARLPTCRDVNECVDKPNACPVQSTCLNSAGSYRCNCLSGWRNQGAHTCVDIDECSQGSHRCPSNSTCVNTQGSYRCSCFSGWRNHGHFSCVDIDECLERRYSCPSNSHCVNTQGSYRCDCNRCYYKSGGNCQGMY